jgi:hypothetical protein
VHIDRASWRVSGALACGESIELHLVHLVPFCVRRAVSGMIALLIFLAPFGVRRFVTSGTLWTAADRRRILSTFRVRLVCSFDLSVASVGAESVACLEPVIVTERAKLRPDQWQHLSAARLRAACLACAITVGVCPEAIAQTPDDPAENAPVHLGPLSMAPAIAFTNLGRDSNVFNEPENPRSDLTATVAPSAQVWLRMGRAQLSGMSRLDAIFFKQYSDQGTVSSVNTGRLDMVFNRLRPFVSGSFLRLHDRPSAEIDVRVQRVEHAATLGLGVRLAARTTANVSLELDGVSFGGHEGVLGSTLRNELDRSQQVRGIGLQYELTPLTTLLVDVRQERTRFKSAGDRDANGIRLFPGFVFKPTALVSGDLHVGYLRYTPEDPRIPNFSGVIAAVNIRSVVGGSNELALGITRDLSQSIEAQVYYVQTRASAGVTRQLNERWSLSAAVSRQWLAYSNGVPGGPLPVDVRLSGAPINGLSPLEIGATRPDTVSSVGFGIGLRLTPTTQVGFSAGYAHRDAALASGRYDNLRTLASVTYALR